MGGILRDYIGCGRGLGAHATPRIPCGGDIIPSEDLTNHVTHLTRSHEWLATPGLHRLIRWNGSIPCMRGASGWYNRGLHGVLGEGLVALQHHIPKRVCGGDIIPSEDLTNHATPRNTLLLGEHPAPKVMTSGTTHYYMSYLRREHHIPLPGGGPFPVRTL